MEFESCERCGGNGVLPSATSLKALRQKAKLEQKAVASRMGISASYLSDLESGKRPWNYGLVEEFERALKIKRGNDAKSNVS